jgi:lysozyme|tara:strand:- start:482 stop:919 length:438 start_codon:yes stop_codon:yes gene_type:complete
MVKDYTDLMERIKKHEGFVPKIYKDSLGFATIGYGHLVLPGEQWEEGKEYSKEQLEHVFKTDFNNAVGQATGLMDGMDLDDKAREVIIEMVFQLGVGGVGKFKKMWEALRKKDYGEASFQMMDSRWAKQTPNRAESLSKVMRSCS